MTLVKVCGLTRADDVVAAVAAGADACGFVVCASPRRVDRGRLAGLVACARAAFAGRAAARRAGGGATGLPRTVVVAATEPAEALVDLVAEAGAEGLQLSGGADGPPVAAVRAAAAARGLRLTVIAAADAPDAGAADLVLLDSRRPGLYGGSGVPLDWERLAGAPGTPPRERLVLAGGLDPGNVARAVALLRPLAVDVASGVESAPGRKDHVRLRAFVAAVRRADAGFLRDDPTGGGDR